MHAERLPGDPRRGRRLRGIPRAGELRVNGEITKKGHVPKEVKRLYRHRDPAKYDGMPVGPMEMTCATEGKQVWFEGVCEDCGGQITAGTHARRERESGRLWHMGGACVPCHDDGGEEE